MLRRFPRLYKSLIRLGTSRVGVWIGRRIIQPLDHLAYQSSEGRFMLINLLLPSLMLVTTGAKSGLTRSVPLAYLRNGTQLVLIASSLGARRHPSWYYNLRANPICRVRIQGCEQVYRARQAEGTEREDRWSEALRLYPGFGVYQQYAEGRQIPVMVLEPL